MGQQLMSNGITLMQRELQTFEPSAHKCLALPDSLCHQKGSPQRDRQATRPWMLRIKTLGQQDTETELFWGQLCFVYNLLPSRICKNMQMCLETRPGDLLHCGESGFTRMLFWNRRAEGHFRPTDRHRYLVLTCSRCLEEDSLWL